MAVAVRRPDSLLRFCATTPNLSLARYEDHLLVWPTNVPGVLYPAFTRQKIPAQSSCPAAKAERRVAEGAVMADIEFYFLVRHFGGERHPTFVMADMPRYGHDEHLLLFQKFPTDLTPVARQAAVSSQ